LLGAEAAPPQPVAPGLGGGAVKKSFAEAWYVDRVSVSGDRLAASGWSMPLAFDEEPPEGWFRVNGRRFDELRCPLPRPDVAAFFRIPEAERSGFEGSIGDLPEPYPDGVLEIVRVRPGTPAIERGRDSWFLPDPALHADLPDADRRFRVIGDRDATGFLVSGATDFHRLDRVVAAVAGRKMDAFGRVLDWGVGCGRLARHFPMARCAALTGCDIDHDNVAWCNAHLPGRFVACKLSPPLPFDDAGFDLVYSVSVFTHFLEEMQLKWLAELGRVMAPGALLLTTIHGQTSFDFGRYEPDKYRQLEEEIRTRGIVFSHTNAQLDGHVDHGGEYVNVFHDLDYVRRVWSRFFDVLHILPGYIGTHDLVVLRKR
jgi:hypothetical protein